MRNGIEKFQEKVLPGHVSSIKQERLSNPFEANPWYAGNKTSKATRHH